jgi:hypothetical protein
MALLIVVSVPETRWFVSYVTEGHMYVAGGLRLLYFDASAFGFLLPVVQLSEAVEKSAVVHIAVVVERYE